MAAWQDPKTLAIWLGTVFFIVIFLIGVIIVFTKQYYNRLLTEETKLIAVKLNYQKQLVQDSVHIQEQERKRVSLELHDDLLSRLNTVLFGLRAETKQFKPDDLLEDCIHTIRRISHDLRPPLLEENSFLELLERILNPLQGQYKIEVHHHLKSNTPLEVDAKLQLLRIAQEILNNIIKHAQASCIQIQLRHTARYLTLVISDDGAGFDQSKKLNCAHKY